MNQTLKHILKRIYWAPSSIYNRIYLWLHGAKVESDLWVLGRLFVRNRGCIHIGSHVRIRSGLKTNPIGRGTRTCIQVFRGGRLLIGSDVAMSNVAISVQSSIIIQDHVMIGGGCTIYDTDFHSLNPYIRMQTKPVEEHPATKPILIKEYAFIGAGTYLLKGAVVGRNSVVGAGSVVSGEIPDNQIWAGNPARFIRELRPDEMRTI